MCNVLILIILEYIYITFWPICLFATQVLILIILEYIYIITPIEGSELSTFVLILIILEYIYIPHRSRIKPSKNEVLILIILEYIYMINIKYKNPSFESLNPYYTGIHLHTGRRKSAIGGCRLNPYYTGIHLHVIFSGISVYILLS